MPELPEVETVRRGLNKTILNKKIREIKILKPKLVRNSLAEFREILVGETVKNVARTGKLLIFEIAENTFLLVHLKMTGQLIFQSQNEKMMGGHPNPNSNDEFPNKYSHLIFDLGDGEQLFYNDLRQFGYLEIVDKARLLEIQAKYGIEPGTANYTWENFREILAKKKKTVLKSFLLNQQIISGLGNIYVDESLFWSGILPTRTAGSLTEAEAKKLFKNIAKIIAEAIEVGGTTFRNYRDALGGKGNFTDKLAVYGREKLPCLVCGTKIEKTKLNGRGTHFCPHCQK